MPPMSQTERDALEAGTVWWDGELFSGRPDWRELLAMPRADADRRGAALPRPRSRDAVRDGHRLGDDERLQGPAAARVAVHQGPRLPRDDHPEGVRRPRLLRVRAFAGDHQAVDALRHGGGDGDGAELARARRAAAALRHRRAEAPLPAAARARAWRSRASRSPIRTRARTRRRFPTAASCAGASTKASACSGLRVTWDKRYITLGPVATLLGLAFRAYDPDHLVGDREDLGITCALIPTSHPGVDIGRRHMPLNAVFQNGPNSGRDVFIPMDWVIGGAADARQGLADADGMPRGGPRHLAAVVEHRHGEARGARRRARYARVRTQFKTPIGRFEGIEEALTRMGGNLYMMDAARMLTATIVDRGEKPAVLSGIAKLHITERNRAGHQRRDGHRRRQGHLHGAVELPRRRVHADAGVDHRRGREHPDAQPDRVRPGRDPLPSVRAEGDGGDAASPTRAKALARFRRGALRVTCASRCRQLRCARSCMALTGSHFVARAARRRRRRRAAITSSSRGSRRRSRSSPTCRWARSAAR